ncbi:HAMP domain-containing histidine kinase [Mycobacterium hodleri]|uniref:HAMP domain-containing sensor histidine kinase n=1 Tax=Mycolicibacterium hodleri TaxID=49897 RepID=UPI0021F33765|nr:HAMP domain-containing sensor histidine kinase [Mycolicibacterium hodleri]MCV7131874.1 HAMP domain-containing histidine kinase [Mycolicibacterium hodleri]
MTASPPVPHWELGPSWWRRRSLRARLTAAATILIAVGMAAAAVLLVWRVHSVLAADLDANLTRQAHLVADGIIAGDPLRRTSRLGESTVVQVLDPRGTVLRSSGDLDGEPRVFFASPGAGEPTLSTVTSEALDDGPYRVAALTATSSSGPVSVYVAAPTSPLTNSVTELGTALIVGAPVMVALLALIGWWLLGRALRPVDVMRRQAAAIPGTDLHGRLNTPASHDELGRLADTFNDLLGRIEAAADRQRRFVADVAHELRTPLAALRARLEIDLRHHSAGVADAEATSTQRVTLGQVTRLVDLVNHLLELARLDAGAHLHPRPMDLDDLVWEAARDAREYAAPRIDTTGISPVRVLGDPAALRQVVRNLLDNARRHARGTVTISLSIGPHRPSSGGPASPPMATLTVADDGPGVPASDRDRVFERFVRLDEARARDVGGAGLGLAIVADIVAAHDGQVWVEDNQPGARFHVQLPVLSTLDVDLPDVEGC